jgi:hypothetical protein
MIASALDELGLFLGEDLEENHESMFFLKLNEWALRQAGGAWDNPKAFTHVLSSPEHAELFKDYMGMRFRSISSRPYWGLSRFLQHQVVRNDVQQQWGWKDPRTVFTIPLWGKIFPHAKIINIHRNGVAVAASLRARERKLLAQAKELHFRRMRRCVYALHEKQGGFGWSSRCWQLSEGFSLWEEYVLQSRQTLETIGLEQHQVRYEDFLKEPKDRLAEMAEFCGLNTSEEALSRVVSGFRVERASAFEQDPELVDFYDSVKNRPSMRMLGYDE